MAKFGEQQIFVDGTKRYIEIIFQKIAVAFKSYKN